jgi:hypothetical protein
MFTEERMTKIPNCNSVLTARVSALINSYFTQIINELNKMKAHAALTADEREIVGAKFAATALDQSVNAQLNQLEIEGRSSSSKRHRSCYVRRFKAILASKNLSGNIGAMPVKVLCQYLRYFCSFTLPHCTFN